MVYQIDEKNYRIEVRGKVNEIKKWIIALDQVINKGANMDRLTDDLKTLGKLKTTKQFNLSPFIKMFYDRDTVVLSPNVSFIAKGYFFTRIKGFFEQAKHIVGVE